MSSNYLGDNIRESVIKEEDSSEIASTQNTETFPIKASDTASSSPIVSSRENLRKRSMSYEPPSPGHLTSVASSGMHNNNGRLNLNNRPISLSISDHSSSSKRASKASFSQSSTTSSPDSSTRVSISSKSTKDEYPLPLYPNEEAKILAMEQAMEAEREFMEFVKTLKVPGDDTTSSTRKSSTLTHQSCSSDADQPNSMATSVTSSGANQMFRTRRISRSPSKAASNPKVVGLEHLDNLCKLMEELTSLRDQNSKLQKKIKSLECEKSLLNKNNSTSSVASLSLQNSPEIVTKSGMNSDKHQQTPKTSKRMFFSGSEKKVELRHPSDQIKDKLGISGSPNVKKRSFGNILQASPITSSLTVDNSSREQRSKSFSLFDDKSSISPSHHHQQEPVDVSSPSTKARSLSTWTKVMVDAFKPKFEQSKSEEKSSSDATKSVKNDVARNKYFISSSSSSSSTASLFDFSLELYEMEELGHLNPNVQRSSSFTQSSNVDDQPVGLGPMLRRHSLTSIGENSINGLQGRNGKESKKDPISAWGKVKNMIYTRRDSLKKKNFQKAFSVEHKSTPNTTSSGAMSHQNSLGQHSSCSYEGKTSMESQKKAETPKPEQTVTSDSNRAEKLKPRPQLTLTMASGEDLHLRSPTTQESKVIGNPLPKMESFPGVEIVDHEVEDARKKIESQWEKVKKAFLAPPVKREEELGREISQSLPGSPNRNTSVFFIDDHALYDENKSRMPIKDSESSVSSALAANKRKSRELGAIQGEIQKNYEQLQRSLDLEFNEKMKVWERQRQGRGDIPCSPAFSPGGVSPFLAEANLPLEFRRKYDAWQQRRQHLNESQPSTGSSMGVSFNEEFYSLVNSPSYHPSPGESHSESLPLEFRRKLQAWERMKDRGPGCKVDPVLLKEKKIRARPMETKQLQEEDLKPEFKLKVAEWEVIKALSGHSSKNVEEIQKMMPEDFNRKLKEWEMMKDSKPRKVSCASSQAKRKKSSRDYKRRAYDDNSNKVYAGTNTRAKTNPAERDSVWLEKELQKIQREKQRLEREREKYQEREKKLERMREALMKQKQEKEITVKTSKGEEFRFEGISEKFTRKLYEWETQKGIGPELSTIALLGPNNKQAEKSLYSSKENKASLTTGLLRSKSEGSLNGTRSTNSCENNSQNSSQSLRDGYFDFKSFIDKSDPKHIEDPSNRDADNLGARRKVTLSRSDSVRTHTSIQLLDENLSLIGSLQAKGDKCRQIESVLERIDDKMHDVIRSKHKLALIKKEEESEEEKDEKLMVHLDKKLDDLEKEQDQLEQKHSNMQKYLAEETKMQKKMASTLISRLGSFRKANLLPNIARNEQSEAPLATSEQDDVFSDITLIRRIHQLSELLAEATKELEGSVKRTQRRRSSSDLTSQSSSSPAIPTISMDLLHIMQQLRKDMVEILNRQIGVSVGEGQDDLKVTWKSSRMTPTKLRGSRRRHTNSLNMPLSVSESDISCGEMCTKYIESEGDTSRLSSHNSMSRYGSESPLHRLSGYQSNNSENFTDDYNIQKPVQIKTYKHRRILESDEDFNIRSSSYRKDRTASSDNISTPNSGRSRSTSIESSDYIVEEETAKMSTNLLRGRLKPKSTPSANSTLEQDSAMKNIDQVCQLIHELKEQDLTHHKRKIKEQQERLQEQNKSRHCSSDESSAVKLQGLKGNINSGSAFPRAEMVTKHSTTTQTCEQESSGKCLTADAQADRSSYLTHVFVPTKRMKILPPDQVPLTPVTIDGTGDPGPCSVDRELCEGSQKSQGTQVQLLQEENSTQTMAAEPPEVAKKPKKSFLQLEEEKRNRWKNEKVKQSEAEAAASRAQESKNRLQLSPSPMNVKKRNLTLPLLSKAAPNMPTLIKPSDPIKKSPDEISQMSDLSKTESSITFDPSIEALINEMRSRSPSVPLQTPPVSSANLASNPFIPAAEQTPSLPQDETLSNAQKRHILNQRAKEKFFFGVQPQPPPDPSETLQNVESIQVPEEQMQGHKQQLETVDEQSDLLSVCSSSKMEHQSEKSLPSMLAKFKSQRIRTGSLSALHVGHSGDTIIKMSKEQGLKKSEEAKSIKESSQSRTISMITTSSVSCPSSPAMSFRKKLSTTINQKQLKLDDSSEERSQSSSSSFTSHWKFKSLFKH